MRVLDLFAGIGGFTLGLERAGMETIAFCEIEEFPQKVLKKHWPKVPIYDDVRTLTAARLVSDGVGLPDIITGGFPCQDLSTSGSGKGLDGERSGLFYEIIRLISEIRPKFVIMENSPNLLSGNGGEWARQVFGALAEVGYDAEWDIIPASYTGAPHRRERVWIVAYPFGERQPQQRRLNYAITPKEDIYREASGIVGSFQRGSVPYVCGRHDGFSDGPYRLKGLGNAVVPMIPEIIGRAIIRSEYT